MSINSNFKANKCWSCEYYSGKREYKTGIFLGDSVETDSKGKCSCKRSSNYNKDISDSGWCSKYQKWGRIESALAIEAQKREAKKIETQQRIEARKIQEENERQKWEIEKENRRLERERYLASLSPEDREAFLKKEQEEEEAHRLEIERKLKEIRLNNKRKELDKNSRLPILSLVIGVLISSLVFVLGWIPYWYFNSHLNFIISEIEDCEAKGMDPSSSYVQYLYQQGLATKAARNNVIWIPFVLLAIGIVITLIIFFIKKKNRSVRVIKLRKEINELSK